MVEAFFGIGKQQRLLPDPNGFYFSVSIVEMVKPAQVLQADGCLTLELAEGNGLIDWNGTWRVAVQGA